MKEALKYIAGIIFFIIGLFSLFGSFWMGLFLILSGFICFPPTLNIIQKKLKKPIGSTLKYILVIGCLIVSFSFYLSKVGDDASQRDEATHKAVEKLFKFSPTNVQ